jgi:filamentous hemagglutinin family protein
MENANTLANMPRQSVALAVALALASFCGQAVHAQTSAASLPTGGQVTAGTATLTYSPNKLQIDQSSNKAILQWDNFSIGSNAWVNFNQPSSSAVALNRVTGTNPSEIFGRMTANGQVFLTNPSGVLFAPGASVDVGGLFATTLSIANQDFLDGRYNFYNAGGAGSVVNQGNIVSTNGYAALAGPQVRNDGVIVARMGTVALAAGDRVSLDMVGDGLVKVNVDQATLNASVINTGLLQADGGRVLLTARSANALLDTVINNTGVVRANFLIERNGEIILTAEGSVALSGQVVGGKMNMDISGDLSLAAAGVQDAFVLSTGGQNIAAQSLNLVAQDGRRAVINSAAGDQIINIGTGGLNLDVVAGNGAAVISTTFGSGIQTIDTRGTITVTGGSAAANTASGIFQGQTGKQTITAANIFLQGALA